MEENHENITLLLLKELQRTYIECSHYAALNEDVKCVELYNDKSKKLEDFISTKFTAQNNYHLNQNNLIMQLKKAYADCMYYAALNDDIAGISTYTDKYEKLEKNFTSTFSYCETDRKHGYSVAKKFTQNSNNNLSVEDRIERACSINFDEIINESILEYRKQEESEKKSRPMSLSLNRKIRKSIGKLILDMKRKTMITTEKRINTAAGNSEDKSKTIVIQMNSD